MTLATDIADIIVASVTDLARQVADLQRAETPFQNGVLPIANGGTNATTASAALANLGGASSSHTHPAADIVSGTIATARLGSGTASASTLLHGDSTWSAVLLSAEVTGTLPIANGGTGSTTASGALSNLGAAASSHTHAATDITSATIATARLGSGAASAATLLHGDSTWSQVVLTAEVTGTLPIANGGTGATSASAALSNLGGIGGSGTSGRIALFSGASTLTSDAGLAYDTGTNVLNVTGVGNFSGAFSAASYTTGSAAWTLGTFTSASAASSIGYVTVTVGGTARRLMVQA